MAALIAYAAGLSTTGMEILSKALREVFGEVSLQELGKDDLRYSVRMSSKASSVVLVVLDSGSEALCKDIEGGLYSSDKYIAYSGDRELVATLNDRYGLSLVAPEDLEEILAEAPPDESQGISQIREYYESRIADYEGIIKSLTATVRELEEVINQEGYSKQPSEVDSDEVIRLRSQISDLEATLASLRSEIKSATEQCDDLKDKLSALQSNYDSLQTDYNNAVKERTEAQLDGSRKAGVIRNKDSEIAKLTEQLKALEDVSSKYAECKKSVATLTAKVGTLTADLERVNGDLRSRDSEIAQLKTDLSQKGKLASQATSYICLLESERKKSAALAEQVASLTTSSSVLRSDLEAVSEERDRLKEDLGKANSKLDRQGEQITQLNEKNLSLASRIRVLEDSTNRDTSLEETLSELSSAKLKIAQLQNNVFHALYTRAMPRASSKVMLLNTVGVWYDNIRFVFSGSSASRKGTYRNLLKEFRSDPSSKYLVVDVVSETHVDYVFEIGKVVNGLKWFTKGGGVHSHVSSTVAPNVRVLSPGLGYINDGFYLAVDWESRLRELNESGYKVVVYCGDLSNMVGRVLFENFSDVGKSEVYVQGNSVGSRTMISVASGISNIAKSTIKYFDYDAQMSKFVSVMRQKCECQILNCVGR